MDVSRHLCVTANAGSGKTLVLVERYFRIVADSHAHVREVVALTYTDKAAAELKRKIAEKVSDALRTASSPVEASHFASVRSQLSGAVIGTIHSFCAMMLREHPVEAQVDAAFTILEGLDQRTLVQESMAETFRDILRGDEDTPLRRETMQLIRRSGRSNILRTVALLVEKRDHLERWREKGGVYALRDDEVLALWRDAILRFVETEMHATSFLDDLATVVRIGLGRNAPEAQSHFAALRLGENLSAKAAVIGALFGQMLTGEGHLARAFVGAGEVDGRVQAAVRRLAGWRKALSPMLLFAKGEDAKDSHRLLLEASRVILSLTWSVLDRYDRKKLESGRLDFEDLQLRAKRLLQDAAVQRHLAERFKFIMVDEYQDTNRLQYDILLPLLGNLTAGNLFIVGDPKQSIYGFRDANIAVFDRTRNDILRQTGAPSAVVLEESFRPLRDLVAFVNMLFAGLMGEAGGSLNGSSPEVAYDPLIRARRNDQPGNVELLLAEPDDQERRLSEGQRIVRRIMQLVRVGAQVYDREEVARAVRFRDIAVLLRSRVLVPEIEEAFIAHGVPFVITGGVGYFQTQDILDFYNYFLFLLNPSDDVALAGILRSPFYAVSDAELLEHAAGRGDTTLWEHLRDLPERTTEPIVLSRGIAHVREILEVGLRLTVPELIQSILQQTRYVSTISATPRGAQALANLEKLQQMARSYDAQGFTTLYDFASRLRRLIDEEPREGQGTVENEGDAVQIMTIHAAKGLEFPVVIVPHLHRQFQFDRDPLIEDQIGFTVGMEDERSQKITPPIAVLMKELGRRKTLAEEKRIFYVAATRARDMLILSGDPNVKRDAPTFMGWLLDSFGVDVERLPRLLEYPRTTQYLVIVDGVMRPADEEHILAVRVIREEDLMDVAPLEPAKGTPAGDPPIVLARAVGRRQPEVFSATKVRTYLHCPGKYYLRYILGYPDEPRIPFGGEDELSEGDSSAEIVGRAFHAVMQNIDRIEGEPESILDESARALRREVPAGFPDAQDQAADLAAHVRSVIASSFWRHLHGAIDVMTEYTMTCPLGDDFILGTADRIVKTADGVWHVIDFKTEAVDSALLGGRVAEYLPQIKFYALLVKKFFEATAVEATLFFTAHPGSPITLHLGGQELQAFEVELADVIRRVHLGDFRPSQGRCADCPQPAGVCERFPGSFK
jgi:ATP-dependent helicase/nuclease subunit A